MMKRVAKGMVPQRKCDSCPYDFNQCILCILQMLIHTFCNVSWYSALWDEKIWMVGERFVWWTKDLDGGQRFGCRGKIWSVGERFGQWATNLDGGQNIWMVEEKFVWWAKERALPIDWKLHCRMVGYATTHLRARDRTKEQFLHTPPPNTTARKIVPIFNRFFVTLLPMIQLTLG